MAQWVTVWGQAASCMNRITPRYHNRSMRLTVPAMLSGSALRVRLSNRDGKKPLHVLEAALQLNGGVFQPLSFDGAQGVIMPRGGECCSDVLSLPVKRGDDVSISLAFQGEVSSGNCVPESVHCSVDGNFVTAAQFRTVPCRNSADFDDMAHVVAAITELEVLSEEDGGALVCFGDSITQQGFWTRPLRTRMLMEDIRLTLVNKGIGGNRLLSPPAARRCARSGRAGLERFERDVLEVRGVKAVLIALGTNDICMGRLGEESWTDAEMLQKGMESLAARARARGLRVLAATLPPCMGTHLEEVLPTQEWERCALNNWIRSTDIFDAVFDFDAVLRDPQQQDIISMAYEAGDHLHPNELGGLRMAEHAWEKLKGVLL